MCNVSEPTDFGTKQLKLCLGNSIERYMHGFARLLESLDDSRFHVCQLYDWEFLVQLK